MNAMGKSDLMVNTEYDLMFETKGSQTDLSKTGVASPYHTLMQSVYIAVQTDNGDFKLKPKFGANPKRFTGSHLSRELISSIEKHMALHLKESFINRDGLPMTIQAAPVTADRVAIRITLRSPRNPAEIISKIDMMYSVADNNVTPMSNLYGIR